MENQKPEALLLAEDLVTIFVQLDARYPNIRAVLQGAATELRRQHARIQELEAMLEAVNNGGVFAGVTPDNIVLNGTDLDAEIDAAIAAAKGKSK